MPRPRGPRLARALRAAAYCALAVPVLAGAAAQAGAPRSVDAAKTELTWSLKKTAVNPRGEAMPVGSNVIAKSGSLTWQILTAPQVQYDVSYPAPATQLKPSQKYELPVTVSGRVVGGKDTGGYRKIDVIGYLNDRWDNNGPGLWQNCTSPSWGAPVACMPPETVKGKISFYVPQPSRAGETFSWGVGALNCSACYVRFEYVAGQVAPTRPSRSSPRTTSYRWSLAGKSAVQGDAVSAVGKGRFTVDARGKLTKASGAVVIAIDRRSGADGVWHLRASRPGGYQKWANTGKSLLALSVEVVSATGSTRVSCAADPSGRMALYLEEGGKPLLELRRLCETSFLAVDGEGRGETLRASVVNTG